MSLSACRLATRAEDCVPSAKRTVIGPPSSTTCRAVRTAPSALITTPEPSEVLPGAVLPGAVPPGAAGSVVIVTSEGRMAR